MRALPGNKRGLLVVALMRIAPCLLASAQNKTVADYSIGTPTLLNLPKFSDCRYAYLIGINIVPGAPMGADAFHLEACDHILLRHVSGATHREARRHSRQIRRSILTSRTAISAGDSTTGWIA